MTPPADLAPARPAAGVPARGHGPGRGADLLLAAVVAVQALATVAWPRVVTVDGPAHLAGAAALLRAGEGPHGLYLVDWSPVPNLLTTFVLAALLPLLGPDEAERLLVLGYLVGLPLAARYALRAVHPAAGWQALVAVPFAAGYLHAYGFTNFNLALVGFLVSVGVALRRRSGWSPRAVTGLALLLLLTWSAHLLPTLVAGVVVAVLAVCRVAAVRAPGSRADGPRAGGLRAAVVTHLLPPAAAGLPVLALTTWFTVASAGTRGEPVRSSSLPELVLGLVTLGRPLVAWTTWEYAGSVLVAAGLLGLAVLARRGGGGSPERRALAVSALLLVAWYLASPDRYGHEYGFLNDRLSYFPPLLLLLWSAHAPPGAAAGPGRSRRPAAAATAAVVAGTLALVVLRLPTQLQYSRDVAELMSVADAVPRGSTLVPLRLWRDAPVGPDARNRARDPLRHAPGRIAVLRDAVNVGHYEAATPYFPVRFRPGTDPRRAIDPDLTGLEQVPPRVDLTRGPEVVLVVGRDRADDEVLAEPRTQRLLDQLAELYERTAVSQRTGLVEVWQRRP